MNLADTSYSTPTKDVLHKATVVCVTDQRKCERLIKAGRVIADLSHTALAVISVVKPNQMQNDMNALEFLFEISKQHNAIMSIQYSDHPLQSITNFLRNNQSSNVVTGIVEGENSVVPKLQMQFPKINFFTVTQEGEVCPSCAEQKQASQSAQRLTGVLQHSELASKRA